MTPYQIARMKIEEMQKKKDEINKKLHTTPTGETETRKLTPQEAILRLTAQKPAVQGSQYESALKRLGNADPDKSYLAGSYANNELNRLEREYQKTLADYNEKNKGYFWQQNAKTLGVGDRYKETIKGTDLYTPNTRQSGGIKIVPEVKDVDTTGMSFQAQSMLQQIKTPGTEANELYNTHKDLPKFAPKQNADGTYQEWTGRDVKELEAWRENARKFGLLDASDDMRDWSDNKLQKEIDKIEPTVKKTQEGVKDGSIDLSKDNEIRGWLDSYYMTRPETSADAKALSEEDGNYTIGGSLFNLIHGSGEWERVSSNVTKDEAIKELQEELAAADPYLTFDPDEANDGIHYTRGLTPDEIENKMAALQAERDDEFNLAADEIETYYEALATGNRTDAFNQLTGHDYTTAQESAYGTGAFGGGVMYRLDKMKKEQSRRQTIAEAEKTAESIDVTPDYDETLDASASNWNNNQFIRSGDKLDLSYFYANHPWAGSGTEAYSDDKAHYDTTPKEYYMTPKQVETFNKFYKSGKREEAAAYLAGLDNYLTQRKAEYQEIYDRTLALSNPVMGAVQSMGTVLINPIAGAAGTVGAFSAMLGNEAAADPNSDWYKLTRYVDTTREARAEAWGRTAVNWAQTILGKREKNGKLKDYKFAEDAGNFLYNVDMSIADNLMAMGVSKVAGGPASSIGRGIVQLVMSSEAAGHTMVDQLKANKSPLEAGIMALGSGVIEAATEKYSIEALMSDPGIFTSHALGKYILMNTFTEGAEEVASDLMNTTQDEIFSIVFNHKSELQTQIDNYTEKGMSREEAGKQALIDYMVQVGSDFLAGAMSGLVLSGGRIAINPEARESAASRVNKSGKMPTIINAAAEIKGDESYKKLIEGAKAKIDAGENLTNAEAREVLEAITETSTGAAQNVARTEIKNIVAEQINAETNGEKDGRTVQLASQGVTKLILGDGNLTTEEKRAMTEIPQALETVREMKNSDSDLRKYAEIKTAVANKDNMKPIRSIREALEPEKSSAAAKVAVRTARTATQEELEAAKGTRTNSRAEVVADGQIGDLVRLENGEFIVKLNGSEQAVQASDVKATNKELAALINFYDTQSSVITDKFYNEMARAITSGSVTDAESFLSDAYKIRVSAYLGESVPANNIKDKAVAEYLYKASAEDAKAADAERIKNGVKIKTGQGQITWEGVNQNELSYDLRNQTSALSQLFRNAGINLKFVNNKDAEAMYGSYDIASGSVIVNLAGRDAIGNRHHLLVTVSHELTHFLENNSPEAYKQLRDFVMSEIKKGGRDVNQLIQRKISQYSAQAAELMKTGVQVDPLTIDGAISEIVADACDQILGDETVIRRIAETDKSLYNTIKGYVGKFINRFRKAAAGMSLSQSRYSKMIGNAERLAKLWGIAYDEAMANAENDDILQEALEHPVNEFSMSEPVEVRDDGFLAVHNLTENNFHDTLKDKINKAILLKNDEIENQLKKYNITYEIYDGTEKDRLEKLNNDKSYMFSLSETDYEQMDAEYMDAVNNNDIHKAYNIMLKMAFQNGYTELAYHGTQTFGFTNFDMSQMQNQIFVSYGEDLAKTYTENAEIKEIGIPLPNYKKLANEKLAKAAEKIIKNKDEEVSSVKVEFEEGEFNWSEGTYKVSRRLRDAWTGEETKYYNKAELIKELDKLTKNEGIYNVITKIENQLEITFNDDNWNRLPWDTIAKNKKEVVTWEEYEKGGYINTRALGDIAKKHGYRSVKLNNIYDAGGKNKNKNIIGHGSVGIFFNPSDIKSADTIVYDDNGEIIPPSQRFNDRQNDIRYSLADESTRIYLTGWARDRVSYAEDEKSDIFRKYKITGQDASETKTAQEYEKLGVSKNDARALTRWDKEIVKWREKQVEAMGLDEEDLGAQYVNAWRDTDWDKMEEILLNKIENTPGIIPFKAAKSYSSDRNRTISKEIKKGNEEALNIAAVEMANLVPMNAVLIPMPPHTGVATDDTDTMMLAKKISELTKRPVVNALEGVNREKRYDAKLYGRQQTAEDLGFKQVAEIPEGTIPYFIDNVVSSGLTAKAAHDAMGRGITLAFAKGTRSGIKGLKNASPTYLDYKQMHLIPLDERIDISKTGQAGTKYSLNDVVEDNQMEHDERKKISWSLLDTDPAMVYLSNLTEADGRNEDEKRIIRNFRMQAEFVRSTEDRIDELTDQMEATEGEEKQKIKIQIQNANTRLSAESKKLSDVLNSATFRGMQNRAAQVTDHYLLGKTQEEVSAATQELKETVAWFGNRLKSLEKTITDMARDEQISAVRKLFKASNLSKAASELRTNAVSRIGMGELENTLAKIALEMLSGSEKLTDDIKDLAQRLIDTPAEGILESSTIDYLSGRTFTINADQFKELARAYQTRKDLSEALRGTNIKFIVSAQDADEVKQLRGNGYRSNNKNITFTTEFGGKSTLDKDWSELTENVMRDAEGITAVQQALEIVDRVRSARQNAIKNMRGAFGRTGSIDEMQDSVVVAAATLMGQLDEKLKGRAGDALAGKSNKKLAETVRQMQDALKKGEQLTAQTTDVLRANSRMASNVAKTIEYFDTVAERERNTISAEERQEILRELQTEAAAEVVRTEQRYQLLMAEGRTMRQAMETLNKQLRQTRVLSRRIARLLLRETDKDNIPEELKSIVIHALRPIIESDTMRGTKLIANDSKSAAENMRVLNAVEKIVGNELDLSPINDGEAQDAIEQAITDITNGMKTLRTGARGFKGVFAKQDAAQKVHDGLEAIENIVTARSTIQIEGRNIEIADAAFEVYEEAKKHETKGELIGTIGKKLSGASNTIFWGNLTPVYYFKQLNNSGLTALFNEAAEGENEAGLLLREYKEKLQRIADRYHYSDIDPNKKITLKLEKGGTVNITTGQLMSLWATWGREKSIGLNMSSHLMDGGFVIEEQADKAVIGRELNKQMAHRVTENDMKIVKSLLTDDQKLLVDEMVKLMSTDLSELGNKTSMRMYGIKKYTETHYFPFLIWDGVKNKASNAGGSMLSPTQENRIAHKGWTKRRVNNAKNAVLIQDFMDVVVRHVNEVINYNTMAPAIENINKVLNYKVNEGTSSLDRTQRNIEAVLTQQYGKNAMNYLRTWMLDVNGGVTQDNRRSIAERALSLFRMNAVAGSLSVALQQPLSYIRASNVISPKYLMMAMNPATMQGAYKEMLKYSGVAVIKSMGRFDMNLGLTGREYLMPDKMQTRGEEIRKFIKDKSTVLPEKMDNLTWGRMWVAVKAEQKALNRDADATSEEFLQKCGTRFNEIMRETQVYDSVMVRSSNMRAPGYGMKAMTSFMAEPTLTLNLLMDAARTSKSPEGKMKLIRALMTYVLSALGQAAVKGIMGAGRTPEENKTLLENFAAKFASNFIGEANPLSLIPGYGDMVDILQGRTISDNALGVLEKMMDSIIKTVTPAQWNKSGTELYRQAEDSLGQLAQLFTGVPVKNLMRDGRAIYNYFLGNYANRPTSEAVLRKQWRETVMTTDLIGALNTRLGEMGVPNYGTSATDYYERIYKAQQEENDKEADELTEYIQLAKGKTEKAINSGLVKIAKADETKTAEETARFLLDNELADDPDYIRGKYLEGELSRQQAEDLYKEYFPKKSEADVHWTLEELDYKRQTGESKGFSVYGDLISAFEAGNMQEIRRAVKEIMDNPTAKDQKSAIKTKVSSELKGKYMSAARGSQEEVKTINMANAALDAAGFSAEEREKYLSGWKKEKSKN